MKGGRVESELLHTEKILADRKTFFLDLKQNSRGMVVKITEDVGGNRDTIMVPAEILGPIDPQHALVVPAARRRARTR